MKFSSSALLALSPVFFVVTVVDTTTSDMENAWSGLVSNHRALKNRASKMKSSKKNPRLSPLLVPPTSPPTPSVVGSCGNDKRRTSEMNSTDLTEQEKKAVANHTMYQVINYINPNAGNGTSMVKDQQKFNVTELTTLSWVPDAFASTGLGSKFNLTEVRANYKRDTRNRFTETVDGDDNVKFRTDPFLFWSNGEVSDKFSGSCVNGVTNSSDYQLYASSDEIEGTLIEKGGYASATGATTYADGTGVNGYALAEGSMKIDPKTNATSMRGYASFRGTNLFGARFTGDTDTFGYIDFDGSGKITKQGGYAQMNGQSDLWGLFSFTGVARATGYIENYPNGTSYMEGFASAVGNTENFDGSKISADSSSAGYSFFTETGVGLRGGGWAKFDGSNTGNTLFPDFTGRALASGFYQLNENGTYTFAGFACLGFPEGCELNIDGTYNKTACVVQEHFCTEGTITF